MIELDHVSRVFEVGGRPVRAVDDVSLILDKGDHLSIMGPSGSGKSTLLNIVGCLDRPSSGTYRLSGQDVTKLDDRSLSRIRGRRIGFVFQSYHLVPRMTAAQNVELLMVFAGVERPERAARVAQALEAVGLSPRAHHRPEQLSGGERQRVAIARAVVMQPEVLLADEPTGNLDTASGSEVMHVLEQMNAQGLTLLVVTHDSAIAHRAPRQAHMIDGKLGLGDRGSGIGERGQGLAPRP